MPGIELEQIDNGLRVGLILVVYIHTVSAAELVADELVSEDFAVFWTNTFEIPLLRSFSRLNSVSRLPLCSSTQPGGSQ
jgi:hypothetical protein